VLLAATLVAASLLDYALTRSNDRPSLDDGRVKGDTYFQEVVGEMAAAAGGTEQGCLWSQTDDEVHVSVAMPADARAKDCQCKILESSLSLTIKGSVVLRGKLFRRVKPDDCDWAVEEEKGERLLKLTLAKSIPTKGTQHWPSVLAPP